MSRSHKLRRLAGVLSLAGLCALPARGEDVRARSTCQPQQERVSFHFDRADIVDVLDVISRIRCEGFILTEEARGKGSVTILSPSPVTAEEAWSAFVAALNATGLALVPAGAFWKVVPSEQAPRHPLPLYEYDDGRFHRLDAPAPSESAPRDDRSRGPLDTVALQRR